MTTPDKANKRADKLSVLFTQWEDDVFLRIAKTLATGDLSEYTADWAANKLKTFYKERKAIDKGLALLIQRVDKELPAELAALVKENFEDVDKQLAHRPLKQPITELSAIADQILEQADRDLKAKVFAGVARRVDNTFANILQQSANSVLGGTKTLQQAVRESVLAAADRGLDSGFLDTKGRRWSAGRYAKTVLKTAMQDGYNKARVARMKDRGIYTVMVSSLPDAREACSYCQGTVIDTRPLGQANSGYPSAEQFGYGTPGGHRGVNCRHQWYPFDPEYNYISDENEAPDPEEAQANYKLRQKEAELKRGIADKKREINLLKALGEDYDKAAATLARRKAALQDLTLTTY